MGYSPSVYRAEKTISNAAVNIRTELAAALALHSGVNRCEINIVDNAVRFTLEGTTPTATKGMKASAGQVITLQGYAQIYAFQTIRDTADTETELEFFAD